MEEKTIGATGQLAERVTVPQTFASSDFKVKLLPLEEVAYRLAGALFFVITAVMAIIVIDWLTHRPAVPTLAGLTPEQQKAAIDSFKQISEVVWDRTSKTFDLIVIKALLPVFATVVGFLLGKRS